MSVINASQLLYSRVEPAYSPQRKGGFQTVYQTSSLAAADVVSIEERVQSFTPLETSQVRYQYFPLANNAFVITHSCKIESHREITDAEGRTGAFIAHCLILTQAEFAKVDYNPFAIISAFAFVQDPVAMVERFGQATGIAPAISIPIETSFPTVETHWEGKEAEKFVLLAEAAPSLRKEQQSVQILGETAEVLSALNLLFRLIRRQTRLLCSFDVSTDNATIKAGLYWGIGRPQRQSRLAYLFHATQHRVTGQIDQPLPADDLYLHWLKQALPTQPLGTVSAKAPRMQEIGEAFASKTTPLAEDLEPALYAEFAETHQGYIIESLQSAFGQFVRPELAAILTRHALDRWQLLDNLQIAARQQLNARQAAALILAWIEESKPQLDDKEWSQLENLAQQAAHPLLLYLAVTLRKKADRKAQAEALARLDRNTFHRLLPWLLDPIAPADLVTPSHLDVLVNDKRLAQMTNTQMVDLVQAIVQVNGARHLDALAAYVNRLEQKELNQIEKSLKKVTPPKQFVHKLQLRREQLGPEQSLWKRFLPKSGH